MPIRNRPRRRPLIPTFEHCESRIALASSVFGVTSVSQDSSDLVGPDAAVGPDGIADLHIHLGVQAQYWVSTDANSTVSATSWVDSSIGA